MGLIERVIMHDNEKRKQRADLVIEVRDGNVTVEKNRLGHEGINVVTSKLFAENLLKAPYNQTYYFIQDERAFAVSLDQARSTGMSGVLSLIEQTLQLLTALGQGSRELSLVRTKLDEARLWLREASEK